MKNILAIDIGNTNITMGLFSDERLVKRLKASTGDYAAHGKNLKKFAIAGKVVISSVVPLATSRLLVSLNRTLACEKVVVGKDIEVPIKNLYRIKGQVGQDRLVNAYAAKSLYGYPSVIIDFGTAITFDIVSRGGQYLGGLILPGIELGLASLYNGTALLPKVELREARELIGRDTVSSMRGGILFGYAAMCDGLIAKYKVLLGRDLKVIATGGNASLIKKYSTSIKIVDEDLTLKGLNLMADLR